MSDLVRIVEVGPRDGLQNEKTPVTVADRIAFIEALVGAGLHTVEVGAFVSPKAIPQMVNSDQVVQGVSHHKDSEFHVLVPNVKGYEAARAAGARVIAVFASASEGFSRANINCSVAESIDRFRPVVARAKAAGGRRCSADVVGYWLLRSVARRHHRHRHAAQGPAPVARGGRRSTDGPSGDALSRHLWPGAGQSLRGNRGGRAGDRFRRRWSRRLPGRTRRYPPRPPRGRGPYAGRGG